MKKYNIKQEINKYIGHFILLLSFILLLFPHFVMLTTSFKSLENIYDQKWFPDYIHFENLIDIWQVSPLYSFLRNSFFITIGAVILILLLGIPAAYATSRFRFHGRNVFLYTSISLQMFGAEIIIIGLFRVILAYRLIDTYLSLVLVNTVFNLPIAIWVFHNYLKSVPMELDLSARVDGAKNLQILLYIIIPIIIPAIIIVAIISYLNTWNEFIVALTFISSPEKKTITIGLFGFIGRWQTKWNYLMLGALISTLPILIFLLLFFKYLKGGLILGSLKE